MIVTAHQPNYLPGLSVIEKVEAADAVIWLDEVQYSHGGWTNRNRMPDGSWLTVPVERRTDMGPINRVRISEHGGWRDSHCKALKQHYKGAHTNGLVLDLCAEIMRPYRLLIGLNLALLRLLIDPTESMRRSDMEAAWYFQSHLDGGHAVWASGDEEYELAPISQRIAMMVAELGGDVYLSGPSGRNYLDEKPFDERGIKVDYWKFDGPNDCAVSRLTSVRG
jgi:hypothetical protein